MSPRHAYATLRMVRQVNAYVDHQVRGIRHALLTLSTCAAFFLPVSTGRADAVADFYKGRTITIEVGYGPGGGYDLTSRVVARFLGDHIPGRPNVVVQNVPGAGGLKVANTIFNGAPADGTVLGVFAFDVALEPYYGETQAMFDPARFAWIGSMDTDTQYCGVWKGAGVGIRTLHDLIASPKVISFGSSAPGTVPSSYPLFFKNALGAPVKVINGYTGTKDIILAMRRGEVDGTCGLFESQIISSYMSDITAGDLQLIMQSALNLASPKFPDPSPIMSVMTTDKLRDLARLVFGPSTITRPLAAPPGTPMDRIAALRNALFAVMKDERTIAEAAKMSMTLQPKPPSDIDEVIESFKNAPPELLKEVFAITHSQ